MAIERHTNLPIRGVFHKKGEGTEGKSERRDRPSSNSLYTL